LNLQLPEAGDEENEDADRHVLKRRHLARSKTGVVTRNARMVDLMLKIRIEEAAHGGKNYPLLL
jgi:hypothetical protein